MQNAFGIYDDETSVSVNYDSNWSIEVSVNGIQLVTY